MTTMFLQKSLEPMSLCISKVESINRLVNCRVYSIPRFIARLSYLPSMTSCQGSGQSLVTILSKKSKTYGARRQKSSVSLKGFSEISRSSLNVFQATNLSLPYRSNTVGYVKIDFSGGCWKRILIIQYQGLYTTVAVIVGDFN